jgi:hypothetical protein
MTPTAVPSRITIDFRDAAMPSRTWILGLDEADAGRMELIAFDGGVERSELAPPHRAVAPTASTHAALSLAAVTADCLCPEFCERDHANE